MNSPAIYCLEGAFWFCCISYISFSLLFAFFPPGCRLPRISEHSSLYVSELRRPCHVWPLCCPGAFWVQLSRRPLLLLCKGQTAITFFLRYLLQSRSILDTCYHLKWFCGVLTMFNYKCKSMIYKLWHLIAHPTLWPLALF